MSGTVTLRVTAELLGKVLALGSGRYVADAWYDRHDSAVVFDVVAEDAPEGASEMNPTLEWHRCPGGHRDCLGRVEITDPGWKT